MPVEMCAGLTVNTLR